MGSRFRGNNVRKRQEIPAQHYDEKLHGHDPEHIEPCYDMIEFDTRLGTPGLHHVGSAVRARARATVLPPDLFRKYERDAFWDDPVQVPPTVRVA